MKNPTPEEIEKALEEINNMTHIDMCKRWRFGETPGTEIYIRSDLPTGEAFKKRLFEHFGGFNAQISKQIGWNK